MANFNKRHYEMIAETLDTLGNRPSHLDVVQAFEKMLRRDNPKFKASLFYFAAGEPEIAAQIKGMLANLKKIANE